MVTYKSGSIFDIEVDYYINTVNCVGVMGKGIALKFKKDYPTMFEEYKIKCNSGEIDIGNAFVWKNDDMFHPVSIINLPTKLHWKDPSSYVFIQKGLNWLHEYFKNDLQQSTVAMPAIGCGCGGLDWSKVKLMIDDMLSDSPAQFYIFNHIETYEPYWRI